MTPDWFLIAAVAPALTLLIGVTLWNAFGGSDRRTRKEVDDFARLADLAPHPDAVPAVSEELARRRQYLVVSALLGVLGWLAVMTFGRLWDAESPVPVVALGLSLYTAMALAVFAAHAGRVRHASAGAGSRVAHARSTRVLDYVMPLELYAARVFAVLPLVLLAVWAAVPRRPDAGTGLAWYRDPPLMIVLGVASLAMLAASEALQRAIVRAPQPAHSVQALAFDDALRAQALRDVMNIPVIIPALAVFHIATAIAKTAQSPSVAAVFDVVQTALPLAMFGYAFIWYIPFARKNTRYRRRLWAGSTTPAGVTGR
jgi:hypothetical protein